MYTICLYTFVSGVEIDANESTNLKCDNGYIDVHYVFYGEDGTETSEMGFASVLRECQGKQECEVRCMKSVATISHRIVD